MQKKTGLSVRNPIDGARHNIWLEGIVICELYTAPFMHIGGTIRPRVNFSSLLLHRGHRDISETFSLKAETKGANESKKA